MAYLVNKTDGTLLARVFDGQTDSPTSPTGHSSITLIGKQVSNYGELQNENLIHILENFSNNTSPTFPIEGQLWWNNTTKSMNAFDGATWRPVTGFTGSSTMPVGPNIGDQWWDISNDQYKIYNGTTWVIVGPSYSKNDGTSGAIVESVYDTSATKHTLVKIYHNGNVTAIVSRDAAFTPNVAISGFTTINPGITFTSNVDAIKLYGTATNADTVGNLTPSLFVRKDIDSVINANLYVTKQLNVGTNYELGMAVSSGDVYITNQSLNKAIYLKANVGGTIQSVLSVDGTTGLASVIGDPNSTYGIATRNYVLTTENSVRSDLSTDIINNVAVINNTITTSVSGVQANVTAANVQIALRAPINSPTFTGTPQSVTTLDSDSSANIATTKFVANLTTAINNSIVSNVNTLSNRLDVANVQIALRAPIDSPTFTGTPLSTTPSNGDNSTKIATTAFIANAISSFDTTKIYNGSTHVLANSGDIRLTVSGTDIVTVTGSGMTTTTQSALDNSTKVATTAYVDRASKIYVLNNTPYTPTVYVSALSPDNGTGQDGDMWFQYQV